MLVKKGIKIFKRYKILLLNSYFSFVRTSHKTDFSLEREVKRTKNQVSLVTRNRHINSSRKSQQNNSNTLNQYSNNKNTRNQNSSNKNRKSQVIIHNNNINPNSHPRENR